MFQPLLLAMASITRLPIFKEAINAFSLGKAFSQTFLKLSLSGAYNA